MTLPEVLNSVFVTEKAVAITFDDGPNPQYTTELLSIFRDEQVKATFFMIGEQIKKAPDVARMVHEEGHEIGNHTFTHPYLTQLELSDCLEEIRKTDELIEQTIGVKPRVFRPPYLDFNPEVSKVIQEFDYSVIGAVNTEAMDWEQPGVQHIFEKSLKAVRPGSVLIFHDGFGDRSQTVEAVRQLVVHLKGEGYQLVTVSKLLKFNKKIIME